MVSKGADNEKRVKLEDMLCKQSGCVRESTPVPNVQN